MPLYTLPIHFTEMFDQNEKSSKVEIKCEEDKNELFQRALRAGHNIIIRTEDWYIFTSKFFIDMCLTTKSSYNINTNVNRVSNANNVSDNNAFLEEGSTGMTNIENSGTKENKFNTRMTVNALHLAIFAKQSGVIKSLIDHVFSSAIGNEDTSFVFKFLGEKVVLDFNGLNEDQFSNYDRSLNKMNALHLSCRYHPDAIKILFDAIKQSNEKHNAEQPCLSSIVNHKENILGKAPLHITAKKSFIDATR